MKKKAWCCKQYENVMLRGKKGYPIKQVYNKHNFFPEITDDKILATPQCIDSQLMKTCECH